VRDGIIAAECSYCLSLTMLPFELLPSICGTNILLLCLVAATELVIVVRIDFGKHLLGWLLVRVQKHKPTLLCNFPPFFVFCKILLSFENQASGGKDFASTH
jgi:hypothetical protein